LLSNTEKGQRHKGIKAIGKEAIVSVKKGTRAQRDKEFNSQLLTPNPQLPTPNS